MSAIEEANHSERLLERLPLVTYTLRREAPFGLVYLSPQSETTFGFGADDFDGDDFWERQILAEDRPRFLEAFARLRDTGERLEVEYRVHAADGRPLWIRDTAAVDDELIHGYLVDITREKELEQALLRERATLDAFFQESAIGLAITDGEGRYVRINDALARMNGAPAEVHLGRTLAQVSPQVAEIVEPYRERAADGSTFRVDVRDRHILLSYMPFEVDGERYTGRVVVDMTEQRRAEQAEEQFRALLERLPLVAYVNAVEPRHRARYLTPRIESLTGYTAAEFLADPELADRLIHPDDFPEILARESEARRDGRSFEHEYRIVRADGSVRWVLDRMETVCDDDGTQLYELGFLVDVTERHETENLLRAVWDGAFEAIVITDDAGTFVDLNPAACNLFGYTRDELVGENYGKVLESWTVTWADGGGSGFSRGDAMIRRSDGVRREGEYALRESFLPGRKLSVVRDATEHKQMQRELWRAQKLESVARLAGGVAHDFNNLLTAIRGYAQLLQMRVPPGTAESHHALEIDRAADRAAALTAQLLALGRRQTLQARPVDLNRHLDELRDSLVELAGPRNELEFELDPGLRAVRVDTALFGDVVLNLVANAADAIEGDGGRIVVRTENVEVAGAEALDDGAYVVLAVSDTGRGLDEATLEHVFEPFFTTKGVGEGSGLGLASAYGMARQSGGTITVSSEPGRGSTFSVYLPVASAGTDAPPRDGDGETVLVVERDPAVRDVVFEVLTDARYRVLTSRTSVDAVRLAERFDGPIDLLLTDLDDARLEALARELRGTRPALRALSLDKPYTPERLQRSVRASLDGGTPTPVSG